MSQRSIFPARMRFLSGSALKTLAIITMLIDHSAICFRPLLDRERLVFLGTRMTYYHMLRGVGRIAFPLFCFLLAEGCRHTRSRARYALSLFLFALLSELPYNLFNTGTLAYKTQNVFFTLLLGCLAIWAIEKWRQKPFLCALALLGLAGVSLLLKADYGWAGYCFIVLLYLLAEQPVAQLFAGITLLPWPGWLSVSFLPMNLYNGKRGYIRGPVGKYFFYAFYPLHLLLLWQLHLRYFGY